MGMLPPASLRHAVLVLAATCVTLTMLSGAALAKPQPAPPQASSEPSSEPAPPQASSQPAPPQARAERCPNGSLCSWPNPDFAGSVTEIKDPYKIQCQNLPRAATSAINDMGASAEFFAAADCRGTSVITVAGSSRSPDFLKATSVRFTPPERPQPASTEPTQATGTTQPRGTGTSTEPVR